jgi:threonine aldolase
MPESSYIDLRSDTVTKPTAEMRRAMMEADVGDDVYMEDPTVNRLQARAAEIFGREAALFVPTGSMGNQIAVKLHTQPGQEVVIEARGHIYNYEVAAMAMVSGALPRSIYAEDGILHWDEIKKAIRPKIYYCSQTGLIALENTHNMAGGAVYPVEVAEEICDKAHEMGIPVHLDGARVFNAATVLKKPVAEITRRFDSVMFCLSKGLCAPVGSMLVGSRTFIERAWAVRKMLGGGMRQVGVLAAAGLIALEKMPQRLAEDHENAQILARQLAEITGLKLNPEKVVTNILVCDISGTKMNSAEFAALLKDKGVLIGTVDSTTVRMLTHHDVTRDDMYQAADIIKTIVR